MFVFKTKGKVILRDDLRYNLGRECLLESTFLGSPRRHCEKDDEDDEEDIDDMILKV